MRCAVLLSTGTLCVVLAKVRITISAKTSATAVHYCHILLLFVTTANQKFWNVTAELLMLAFDM